MESESVLGHLALRFTVHPENLATEALTFILRTSNNASGAFRTFVKNLGVGETGELHFTSQQGGLENSIPDMRCIDDGGRVRVLVENKFWAGLTDNQPETYLRELPAGVPSLVLFVVPEKRLAFVWNEIVDRCKKAGIHLNQVESPISTCVGDIGGGKRLAATSWALLLDILSNAAVSAGDFKAQKDIAQLQGLCGRMDSEGFMPLRGDELTNLESARRFTNLSDLPFEIAEAAAKMGYCVRKRESSFRYGAGTYMEISGFTAWLGFDLYQWREYGVSPIWLNFYPGYGSCPTDVLRYLVARTSQTPKRCFEVSRPGSRFLAVPIFLQTGVEKKTVIEYAVRQIEEVGKELLENQAVENSQFEIDTDSFPAHRERFSESEATGKEVVLELGGEGGGFTVFREKNSNGAWTFWTENDETMMEDHTEGIGPGNLVSSSEPSSSLIDALAKLDRYPWRSFTPKLIHPEFHELIRTTVQERGTAEEMSRWNKYETRRF